ncbi:hypothetical protein KJ707_00440 [Patescibacteria group bacterium]|nr:hypothetical protein [Patescibacteria group bacterium]MBU1967102.1 hypothetical protein [Patescibacteria group bacterium]MBU2543024.1 hypothetical protein [Patescibacteria group bacterium]
MKKTTAVIDQIRDIIERELLVDTSEIEITDSLETALGIDLEIDFARVISSICQKFDVSHEAKELLTGANTLKQLASIVIEEAELG